MRALPLGVFVPLPSLIKQLSIPLNEGRDLCPQLRNHAHGKYLLRKALESISQVVKELGSAFCSQSLALSLSKKGKSRSLVVSLEAPLILMVSHVARDLRRCALGFSEWCPANCSRSTKDMSAGLSSKLLASTAGLTMEEVTPDACGRV